MIRVLHVISSLDPRAGGPAVAIKGFAAAQKQCGIEPVVIATYRDGESDSIAADLIRQGITVSRIGPAGGALRRHSQIVPKLTELIAAADVVHIHALWEEIQHQAAVVARRLGKPYIYRTCGMLDPWSLAQGRLKKKLYMRWRMRANLQGATALHFTAELERDLTAPLKLAGESIIEPNGLSFAEFENLPARGSFRARYPQLGNRLVVLFLSRIHKKKGLDLLIPAFAAAQRRGAALVIAGPDDVGYGSVMKKLADDRGIGGDVIFAGMLHGIDRLAAMNDADLFVLPSYQENFGIVVVEAMATGRPVIISDQVNIHREVVAARVGAVVPTQIEPLTQELTRWLADAELRESTSRRALTFVRERYDWQKIACRWKEHYHNIANRLPCAQTHVSTYVQSRTEPIVPPITSPERGQRSGDDFMRIIHVISSIDSRAGGTTKALVDLTCAQAAAGLDVTIVSSYRDGDVVDGNRRFLETANVKLVLVGPARGKFSSHPQLQPTLARLTGRDTVMHIHALWEDAQHHAAVVAHRSGTPIVWMPHGMLDPWSLRQSKWKKKLVLAWRLRRELNNAAAFAFTTDIERDLVEPLRLPGLRIVEPLGLDFSEFDSAPAAGSFRAKFPQAGDRRIVLFLGRIHPKKGLDLLIPAFAAAANLDDLLVIAGPFADGYRPVVEAMVARHKLGDRCLLTGMLHGPERLAAMIDAAVFVLPSYQENFGLAVAEAVALGCPTIISDQVNIWRELSAAGCVGVTRTDLTALTTLLKQWLADEPLREAAAARGKAFARQRYDWSRIARNWVGHYANVMQAAKRK